ncbi:hypothetical protein LZP85_16665 [Priestia flexa]|uniref:Uncharacterized protein n=2 Tax=Priestia flexa TaxID=86664 RepID=A0ABU4J921_9BACI|nr:MULTISPECIES: hypothetical protein [Bacillaceae]MCA0965522.1 hypothetical protein [Priestia flexa]MCG7311586.1 hypothetical protein [Priestia flexa]MCM3065064.1 hypothetical protein [Priestia flexa]MDW8517462.1 hypothetical protein [Priestia flexa]MEC0664753.1 hypothetical protein [Priestia flexa]
MLKRNKAILYLLLCGLMLYYAKPYIVISTESLQGIFSLTWLGLALLVVGGNVSSLLYAKKEEQKKLLQQKLRKPIRQRG